ncbi:MAG: S8 family serine peptidase [Proteobacteria bacterium]|nr:S8 family serine peptidase [Pseudomonadota bacterium]
MRLRRLLALALLMTMLLALPSISGGPWAADTTTPQRPAARVIVKYKALGRLMREASAATVGAAGPRLAAAMAQRHGLSLADGRGIDRRTQVLLGGRDLSSAQLAAKLAADDDVEYAVPDERRRALAVPSDPLFAANSVISPAAGQWYLRAPDSTFVSAINAVGAWDISTGSAQVVVADLDTGVRFDHPDLAAKLLPGYDFISDTDTANDGNARDSDASDPGDWTTANQCDAGEAAAPSSWHGTQTAGLIGAQTNNGVGMASVGFNVMVLPVRVLGRCGGYDSDILAGLRWAAGLSSSPVANPNPARVINLSLGSAGSCTAAYTDVIGQLTAAGVVVVASAGNEEGLAVATPANCSGVIAVAGLRHAGTKVGFSSIGPQVTVSAPGGNCVNTSGACLYPILTTINSGNTGPAANTYSDSSNYSVGTSFSAPLVAGTAALMLSVNPSLTPAQVKSLIQGSARAFPTTSSDPTVAQCKAPTSVPQDECLCTTSTCGAGMLDAGAAVAAAAANSAPSVSISGGGTAVLAGSTVAFDGSGSKAAAGRSISSYQWAITAGSGIAAISGSSSGATVSVLTSGSGSFTIRLMVTDSAGAQASASSTVNVNAPAAPTVNLLASSQVVTAGSTVTIDGSGSTVAAGLSVAGYQWAITSGASLASITSTATASSVSIATTGSSSGSFTVRLTVTDSLGQQSNASLTINVTALGPTASIGASAASVSAGSTVSFDGSGSTAPSGRSISSYRWAITSGGNIAAISGSSTAASATVSTSAAGSFTITLTVTDSSGAQDSRTSTVTVTQATASSGGGGGGGATSPGWLLGLALAVAALAWPRRGAAGGPKNDASRGPRQP